MKVKLHCMYAFLCILFFNAVTAQNINIPNYDFATDLNGWSIAGNNISMSNSNSSYTSGILAIENSSFNEETFVITSPTFPLFASDNYVFFTEYGHYFFDAMMGAFQISQLSSVVLKNSSGTVVQSFNLTCSVYGGGPGAMDFCESSPFLITNTDTYYLELTGSAGNLDSNNYDETYNFGTINLYKDNSPHSVQGKVTYDENADNCVTSSYTPSNILVKSTASTSGNEYYSNTNTLGNYGFTFDESGTVITEIANASITSTPANYSNTFSSPQTISNQNFCITSSIVGTDVSVVIVPTTDARPGFNSNYSIVYTNNGGTTASGAVDLMYDNSLVNHLSSSPTENSSTANSLSWNYSNLAPFETRVINVFFNINTPPTVNNGDILPFQANITPIAETNMANNTFDLQQITIGSYDPNDAIVLQGPLLDYTQAFEDIYFRVRFQNTGTASAININVNTILDADLDWSTFTPVYASHAYVTSVNGNSVNFKFDNINLADSTSDEPNSHGLVVFKSKTAPGFTVGDVVECKADIFFDYNLPIVTNTATTQIDGTLSLENASDTEANFTMYPNPVKDQFEVSTKAAATFTITNINGQELQKGVLNVGNNTLNMANVSNGIYFLKVVSASGFSTKKIIKQ